MSDEQGKGGIASVVKAIRVMDCFTGKDSMLSLADLTRMTKYPKSTLHGIISTLVSENLVMRVEGTQSYRLGTHLMEYAYTAKASMPLTHIVAPIMDRLSSDTGGNVYLTTTTNGRLLYLESCYADRLRIGYSEAGKVLPMHCTASGKAMLSYMTEEEVDKIFDRWPLEKKTSNTIVDTAMLKKELRETAQRGFAIDMEEETIGVRCIAVAVLNSENRPVGAISISTPATNLTTGRAYELYERILEQMPLLRLNAGLFPYQYL